MKHSFSANSAAMMPWQLLVATDWLTLSMNSIFVTFHNADSVTSAIIISTHAVSDLAVPAQSLAGLF